MLFLGYKGGLLGNRCSYSCELFLIIWKSQDNGEGPFRHASNQEKSDIIYCPSVAQKFGGFHYQKPMSLYAEILKRFAGSERVVCELTGDYQDNLLP